MIFGRKEQDHASVQRSLSRDAWGLGETSLVKSPGLVVGRARQFCGESKNNVAKTFLSSDEGNLAGLDGHARGFARGLAKGRELEEVRQKEVHYWRRLALLEALLLTALAVAGFLVAGKP